MGGATGARITAEQKGKGLSPRGRGNLEHPAAYGMVVRSIPAWAGQPVEHPFAATSTPVYPRVGGATVVRLVRKDYVAGLSPRGRGNRL